MDVWNVEDDGEDDGKDDVEDKLEMALSNLQAEALCALGRHLGPRQTPRCGGCYSLVLD